MSINKMISMKTAIVDAMELCGTENVKDLMVMARWGELAEKEIGSRYQFIKKIAVLDVSGYAACLPNDAAYMQRALIGDYGCDCTDLFYSWGGVGVTSSAFESNAGPTFLVVDAPTTGDWMGTWSDYLVNCELQDNKIIFSGNYNGQKVTVQYLAYKTDCDGLLEIGENHVRALTYYMCWMYFMRQKKKSNDTFFSANKYESMWQKEVANARAKDSNLTEGERQRMVAEYHDPYAGIGLATGMTTTLGGWYGY